MDSSAPSNLGNVAEATRRRVPLRVLVRVLGANMQELAARISTFKVAILGDAKPDKWESHWRAGDLEAIAWVPASEVNASIEKLRTFPEIVEARISMRDVK
jgi:hypothetical protein